MTEYLLHVSWDNSNSGFYFVPLTLVSTFLHVGRVQITCGLLPTRFSAIGLRL